MEEKKSNILNNKYELTERLVEFKMTHWVNSFSIKDNTNNEIIIDLIDTVWELSKILEIENTLKLTLRKYPTGTYYEIKVIPDKRIFEYNNIKYKTKNIRKILDSNIISKNLKGQ